MLQGLLYDSLYCTVPLTVLHCTTHCTALYHSLYCTVPLTVLHSSLQCVFLCFPPHFLSISLTHQHVNTPLLSNLDSWGGAMWKKALPRSGKHKAPLVVQWSRPLLPVQRFPSGEGPNPCRGRSWSDAYMIMIRRCNMHFSLLSSTLLCSPFKYSWAQLPLIR